MANFDYQDPVDDRDRDFGEDVPMMDVQLVSQRTRYAEQKPFQDIDTARAFQTKVDYGTWMDKFQAKEADRLDTKVTHIMQKYCTPRGRDLKGVSNSIDVGRKTNDSFPYNRQDNRTAFSTVHSSS